MLWLIFLNERLLSLLKLLITRCIILFETYSITLEDGSDILWVYLFEVRHMFDVFEYFFNEGFRFASYFKRYEMLLELIFGQIVVLKNECISMHETESFRKYIFWV